MKSILSSQAIVTLYSLSRLKLSSPMYMNGTGFVVPSTDGCIADIPHAVCFSGQSSPFAFIVAPFVTLYVCSLLYASSLSPVVYPLSHVQ